MQTFYPKIDRLKRRLRSRGAKKRMGKFRFSRTKEGVRIAAWKHKDTPGWARF